MMVELLMTQGLVLYLCEKLLKGAILGVLPLPFKFIFEFIDDGDKTLDVPFSFRSRHH